MDELERLLNLNPENIEEYVSNKITVLDSHVSKNTYGSKSSAYCINGWVNSKSLFLPSGMRKKSFNLDSKKLYINFVKFLQEYFKDADLDADNIKDYLLLAANAYLFLTFDTENGMDNDLRDKIYYANTLGDVLNKPVNVEELMGQGVIRCIEKSAIINNLLSFVDLDSSIIICNAKLKGIEDGHAFCVVKMDEDNILLDPSYFTVTTNGEAYPLIVWLSEDALSRDKISFDISEFGETYQYEAVPNQGTMEYEFPGEEYCATHNIVRKGSQL